MSKPQHTPGPWIARSRHNYPDRDECCGLGWEIEGPPEPQLRGQFAKAADAYLIAAAPDLLAALERLRYGDGCHCRFTPNWKGNHSDACNQARAAIAKARGEQCN